MPTPSPVRRDAKRGSNPLLIEADAVLALAPQLRATTQMADLPRLRAKVAEMVREFEIRARVRGVSAARLDKARVVLCALIDDAVSSMPWGGDADWQPLGAAAAVEAGRGAPDGPALRLLRVARESSGDRELQELICVALALGFDARARGPVAAGEELAQIRAQLAAQVRHDGTSRRSDLSPQWQAAVGQGSALASWLPLWVVALVLAALLAVLYFSLVLALGAKSDKVYAQISALRPPAAATSQALPAPQARLAGPLSAEIAARRLAVRDEIDRSVVVVPDHDLFEPGTAKLQPASAQSLRPVAAALQSAPGRVLVVGHTDGKTARSARYPSDWDLSVDRARAVQDALRGLGVEAGRLRYDGRADTEPLPASDPMRAAGGNGRIEIDLLAGR
jgi:type VI secretion system protein ImpK